MGIVVLDLAGYDDGQIDWRAVAEKLLIDGIAGVVLLNATQQLSSGIALGMMRGSAVRRHRGVIFQNNPLVALHSALEALGEQWDWQWTVTGDSDDSQKGICVMQFGPFAHTWQRNIGELSRLAVVDMGELLVAVAHLDQDNPDIVRLHDLLSMQVKPVVLVVDDDKLGHRLRYFKWEAVSQTQGGMPAMLMLFDGFLGFCDVSRWSGAGATDEYGVVIEI